jgi:hypothetical protein
MGKSWVAYTKNFRAPTFTANAVCTQAEWDAMEADKPGRHTLIQSGIASEAEAERLARYRPEEPTPLVLPRGIRRPAFWANRSATVPRQEG